MTYYIAQVFFAQCYVPAWMGGSLEENGYMYTYAWDPSMSTWKYHNIVNQVCRCCLVTELYLTLCDSMDCSPPGSSVHGVFQARILDLVATSFSRRSSQPRNRTHVSSTGGRILYHWAFWEAPLISYTPIKMKS